jgi:hypothetical protein
MADIVGINSKKTEVKAKPPKHEFTVTFKPDLENRYPEIKAVGYLSLGPVFAAIVDENDMIDIVVAADEILYIKKGPEVSTVQLELPGVEGPVTATVRVLQPGTVEHSEAMKAQANSEKSPA